MCVFMMLCMLIYYLNSGVFDDKQELELASKSFDDMSFYIFDVIFDVVDHVIYVAVDVMTVVVVVSSDGVLQLLNLYFQKRDCQMTET